MRGDLGYPVRIRFSKLGRIRFISHRDVARAFDRALRIAELPLAFTQGFSPRPKISFGLALSVGHESHGEYLDVEFADEVGVDELPTVLTDALPVGLTVTGTALLAERAPALQEAITALEYSVVVPGAAGLASAIDAFLAAPEVTVSTVRKGQSVDEDVRPAVRAITCSPDDDRLDLELSTRPRTSRVGDVLSGVQSFSSEPGAWEAPRIVRTHHWIERGGARHEPLDADRRLTVPAGTDSRALGACA